MDIDSSTREISDFLHVPFYETKMRLEMGFHYNHHKVAEDFIKDNTDVNNSESLLDWYRKTDSYIWELSAYHLDAGFNYSGMCEGISLGLRTWGKNKVLNIGDGIGSLTLQMAKDGLTPTYHDLRNSKTAAFAEYRFSLDPYNKINTLFTNDFQPALGTNAFDAVVSLDFLEHVVNVEEWARAIFQCLKKDGVFIAQNAFACGDAEHGNSIPMHLSINNKYETEWLPMLNEIGFISHPNNSWLIKP